MKIPKRVIKIIVFIALFLISSYLIFRELPVEKILDSVGVYKVILIPVISVFGSNLATASFLLPFIFFLKQSGMNLFFLAGLVAIGGVAGDLLFVYFGKKINEHTKNKNPKIFAFFKKHRDSPYIKLFILLYAIFFPLSNEVMTLALGYVKYPIRKMIIPLAVGNFCHYTILISLGGTLFSAIF